MRAPSLLLAPAFPFTLAALLCIVSCGPVYEGPQLTKPPEGLAYINAIESARKPLPGRKAIEQVGHVPPGASSWDTSVIITSYEGIASREELEAARGVYASRYKSTEYGPVQPMTVGGRPGWAYTTAEAAYVGRRARGLVAVVPWDTVTYSIELSSLEEKWQAPETQQAIVASFDVVRRGRYKPFLYGLVAAVAVVWGVARYLGRRD